MDFVLPLPPEPQEQALNKEDSHLQKIDAVIEKYLSAYSDSTIWHYRCDMKTFFEVIKKNIKEVKEIDIITYAKELEQRGLKQSSRNRKLYSLSKIFSIYQKMGLVKSNPVRRACKEAKLTKKINRQIQLDITKEDALRVINNSSKKTGITIRTLINTALRVSELTGITCDDVVPFNKDFMKIQIRGKGNKVRFVFITTDLYRSIREIYSQKSRYLFHSQSGRRLSRTNLYTQIVRAFRRYSDKVATPHTLRHFFATTKVKEGKDIKAISTYLGHSGINVTLTYYVHSNLEPEQTHIL